MTSCEARGRTSEPQPQFLPDDGHGPDAEPREDPRGERGRRDVRSPRRPRGPSGNPSPGAPSSVTEPGRPGRTIPRFRADPGRGALRGRGSEGFVIGWRWMTRCRAASRCGERFGRYPIDPPSSSPSKESRSSTAPGRSSIIVPGLDSSRASQHQPIGARRGRRSTSVPVWPMGSRWPSLVRRLDEWPTCNDRTEGFAPARRRGSRQGVLPLPASGHPRPSGPLSAAPHRRRRASPSRCSSSSSREFSSRDSVSSRSSGAISPRRS